MFLANLKMFVCGFFVVFACASLAKVDINQVQQNADKPLRVAKILFKPPMISTGRIPTRPPIIRSPKVPITPAATKSWVRSVNTNKRALDIKPDSARRNLRNALASRRWKNISMGRSYHAHHVLPLMLRKNHKQVLLRAARGGFNFNGASNGIRVPGGTHKLFHDKTVNKANLERYRDFLNRLAKTKFTDRQVAAVLQQQTRRWKYELLNTNKTVLKQFNQSVQYGRN